MLILSVRIAARPPWYLFLLRRTLWLQCLSWRCRLYHRELRNWRIWKNEERWIWKRNTHPKSWISTKEVCQRNDIWRTSGEKSTGNGMSYGMSCGRLDQLLRASMLGSPKTGETLCWNREAPGCHWGWMEGHVDMLHHVALLPSLYLLAYIPQFPWNAWCSWCIQNTRFTSAVKRKSAELWRENWRAALLLKRIGRPFPRFWSIS